MSGRLDKFRPIAIVLALALAWFFTPLGQIPMRFVKLSGVGERFAVLFFGGLTVILFLVRHQIETKGWKLVLSFAIVGGYILSTLSIFFAALLLSDGVDRLTNSVRGSGVANAFLIEAILGFIFAGWLIAPIAVVLLRIPSRSYGNDPNPPKDKNR